MAECNKNLREEIRAVEADISNAMMNQFGSLRLIADYEQQYEDRFKENTNLKLKRFNKSKELAKAKPKDKFLIKTEIEDLNLLIKDKERTLKVIEKGQKIQAKKIPVISDIYNKIETSIQKLSAH